MISRRGLLNTTIPYATIAIAGCLGDVQSGKRTTRRSDSSGAGGSVGETWVLGTPGEGLQSHIAGKAFAWVFRRHSESLSLQVQSYSGSEESIRLLGRGDIDVAVASNFLGTAAHSSSNPIQGVDFSGDRALARSIVQSMSYMDLRLFFVTLDEDLQTTADLAGAKVNVGPPGAAWLSIAALDTVGILNEVELVTTSFKDVPFSLKEGRVDATLGTASMGITPPPYIQNMRTYDISVIEYTTDHLDHIRNSPVFQVGDVHVDAFFQKDLEANTIPAATQNFQFWLSERADDDLAYEFAKQSMQHANDIQNFAKFLQTFTPTYAVSGLMSDIPVHPGVARYYKENDLWSTRLTEAE